MNWQQLRKPYWKSLVLMKRKSMTLRPKQGGSLIVKSGSRKENSDLQHQTLA